MSAPDARPLDPLVAPSEELTTEELARYSRHLLLPEVGVEGQRRMKSARVLVVGAGGLGAPVLTYLAAAGVGTIAVVDDDVVDVSNLQRQVLFGRADVGRRKVDVTAARLNEINPHVRVITHATRIDASNALDLFRGYDLILDGTDNFATRYLVNDACVILGLPYVWGSVFRFEGQVSVFWEEHGPQYRDLYSEPPPAGLVPSCAEGGVLGSLCSMVGATMATEALKLIVGTGEPLVGRLLVLDALSMRWRSFPVLRQPNTLRVRDLDEWPYEERCALPAPAAVEHSPGSHITVGDLRALLAQPDEAAGVTLVDVREPWEHQMGAIPGSVLMPSGKLSDATARAELLRHDSVILYCKSGMRSQTCLTALQADGHPGARTLVGGYDAFAEDASR
ncbi:molybdopterin-synthase adenylyltransferase MoeB [Cellulomonas cellasea]|uniref:molybdopterin-synthase adenylyltransferase MoeB n=1 Tax=Cellulomonas cellasea TaxID=43670 RepID=UPI0025A4C95E|nr:molybdopterin-synthase adenylyltransferase MoeB [Cellulomonas cellasea]MDM8085112.1 molybdopterin-synthase adenylyltransferase MoeB [Cellulomonas cellasea]